MATLESQGTVLKVGADASPQGLQTVGQVTSITGLRGGSATVIDVSNLASTAREKKMGLPDEGQVTITCQYDPNDTNGQVAMETARTNRTRKGFTITLTDSPATVFSFNGYVLTAQVDVNIDGVDEATYTVEIDGAVTKT